VEIQKYKATIKGTDIEVIGYITEARRYLGNGAYSDGIDYIMNVTEKSMMNGRYGSYLVKPESISVFIDTDPKSLANNFEQELFKLINLYAKNGLSKPDLVQKMRHVTKNCEVS
jgi:hypothetical protein